MFADPITCYVDVAGATPTTATYAIISQNGSNTVRRNNSAAAGEPKNLKISHQTVGRANSVRDRHMARFECYSVVEGVEDQSSLAEVHVVADIPRSGFSAGQIEALTATLTGFLRGGGGDDANGMDPAVTLERWLGGES